MMEAMERTGVRKGMEAICQATGLDMEEVLGVCVRRGYGLDPRRPRG